MAAAAATALLFAALAGCGGSSGPSLAWQGAPRLFKPGDLPRDRVLLGRVRNASDKTLVLDARRVRYIDARGAAVAGTARFLLAAAHGLYSPTQFGQVQNPAELQRLGVRVAVAPGQALPFNGAWRLRAGQAAPERVEIGDVKLPVPSQAPAPAP